MKLFLEFEFGASEGITDGSGVLVYCLQYNVMHNPGSSDSHFVDHQP